MIDVTDETFAQEVLAASVPVIVDFWAPWCRPCRTIEPILQSIADDAGETLHLVRLDVDDNLAVPGRYGVLTLPTVMLFVDGEPKATLLGARPRRAFDEAFAPFLA